MKVALIATIGLPGSGKTLFCLELSQSHSLVQLDDGYKEGGVQCQAEFSQRTQVVHINYDALQRCSPTRDINAETTDGEGELTAYKIFRFSVLRLVEATIQHLTSGRADSTPEWITSHGASQYLVEKLRFINPNGGSVVILLDDNMFYSSMRYSVYKLAKKYGLSYGQLYFSTPIQECVRRNGQRTGDERIDEAVIVNMAQRLEPPQPSNSWERLSLDVKPELTMEDLAAFLQQVLCSPLVPHDPNDSNAARQESRTITAQDVVHQCDLLLRHQVKLTIANASSSGGERRVIADKANRCRRLVLDYIKRCSSDVAFSLDTTDPPEDGHSSHSPQLEAFVARLYTENLMKESK